MRANAEEEFHKLFLQAEAMASVFELELAVKRITKRITIFIPYLEFFISELTERFLSHASIFNGFECLFSKHELTEKDEVEFTELIKFYSPMVSNDSLVELKLWRTKIQRSERIPNTGLEALDICNKDIYPNIYFLLKVLCTLPVSTSSPERSLYSYSKCRYNNTLAFAAFSTDLNTRRLTGRGPNVFTVHGQGYWTISNDLIGNDPIQRRFCQLYFVESGEANRIRRDQLQLLPAAHRLLPSVLEDLDGLLRDINPSAQAFETMREVWAAENAPGRDPQLLPRKVRMHFVADGNVDRRRYNPPPETVNEVAVVFVGDDGQPPTNVDLVIHDRNPIDPQHRQLQTIPAGSSNAYPMLYPLLFPRGELGWHQRLLQEAPPVPLFAIGTVSGSILAIVLLFVTMATTTQSTIL
ncbi:uncharacterized protein LOC132952308 [Metopolophium dirhodum]|uniref:uncharacterized protein LOC132952308 n=1 Tax=Metopolophium dirhodum TaxID=44670 RepID=UPI0029907A63|nr:uncharacterized protein LOC132952308 [Metopolophium dirhodum]